MNGPSMGYPGPNRIDSTKGIKGVIMATRDSSSSVREASLGLLRDPAAFANAVRPHMTILVRLAARMAPHISPDDVVQEALVRAWRHRRGYDASRGTISSWLLAIVANESRRAVSRRRVPIIVAPRRQTLPIEDRLDVAAAVQRLSPRQRLAVDCHYYAGLSMSETAAVMGCSQGTVKSTLADARARLRSQLEGG